MNDRFRAFSFVDRIHSIQSGIGIRGSYTIPTGLPSFPPSLVAEAVGQLAAWAAMDAVGFKCRPVAGLAAEIDLLSPVHPGQVLELAADLETVDTDAVAYDGTAHADGVPVIRLKHCVGPMLPLEEFDDPQRLRDRFALLQSTGAAPGAFGGLPGLALLIHPSDEIGRTLRATLQVPTSAPFFEDHFPRRPAFPGSLLMKSNLELAAALATQLPLPATGGRWTPRGASDMKLRSFTLPGDTLEMKASLNQLSTNVVIINVETRKGTQLAGSVRVRLSTEAMP
jgi:3-hydroxymyristoyl/3-hydroxydecanoyl-(acyl carrier protein) dehydratase